MTRDPTELSESAAPYAFPVNTGGLTYGGEIFATSFENIPDLILAYGNDGARGYMRKSDMYPPEDETLEEVLSRAPGDRTVTLYDEEGRDEVGTFTFRSGRPPEAP